MNNIATHEDRLLEETFGLSSSFARAVPLQSSESTYIDIYKYLPFIAKDVLRVEQEKLRIVSYYSLLREGSLTKLTPYKTYGLNMVQNQHHQEGTSGEENPCVRDGLICYRINADVSFVIVHYHSYRYVIYVEGSLLPIARVFKQCIQTTETAPPILADGQLESIIKDTIGFYNKRKSLARLGVRPARGIILQGDPGNGKTMLCRYIADLAANMDVQVTNITSTTLQNSFNNNSLSSTLNWDGISFLDDIDISFLSRKSGSDARMACSILAAMDGVVTKKKPGCSIRIFTTNESIANFDPAFMRNGRVDSVYKLDKPTREMRWKFINTWATSLFNGVDKDDLADCTEQHSFAELQYIRTELAYSLVNKQKMTLEQLLQLRRTAEEHKRVGF